MFRVVLFILLFAAVPVAAAAQDGAIDAAMNKCLQTHKANMLRAECYNHASEAWEKDVETKYSSLTSSLPQDLIPAFRSSEQSWEAYRDAQFEFFQQKNKGQHGTGHISGRIIERMAIVKQRAVILDAIYEQYSR